MTIYVDADACPVVDEVEKVAKEYNLPVVLLCDYNHQIQSDYSQVKVVSAGRDAVDFALIPLCKKGDLVVTQDYGVAAMALGKGAAAIHQSGKWYTEDNIDQMLMLRHIKGKERRTTGRSHIRGEKHPGKNGTADFMNSFQEFVRKHLTT